MNAETKAPAKINLHLEVLDERSDGYHDIKTVFHPIPWLHDDVTLESVEPSNGAIEVSCADPDTPENENNICFKAAAKFAETMVVETDYSFGAGGEAVATALSNGCSFDAVFANDVLCMGATRALSEAALRVPEDVKVMGFDDIPACGYLTPALSSVRLDVESLGANAVDLIVRGLRGEDEAPKKTTIGGEILARETTGG